MLRSPVPVASLTGVGAALAAVGLVLVLIGGSPWTGSLALVLGSTAVLASLRLGGSEASRHRLFGAGAGVLLGLVAVMVVWG